MHAFSRGVKFNIKYIKIFLESNYYRHITTGHSANFSQDTTNALFFTNDVHFLKVNGNYLISNSVCKYIFTSYAEGNGGLIRNLKDNGKKN